MQNSSAPLALPILGNHKGPKCPFYGMTFNGADMRFVDRMSDACGLMRKGEKCMLEAPGVNENPDWNVCPLSRAENLRASLSDIMVNSATAPIKLDHGCSPGQVLTMLQWFEHVMGYPFPITSHR